MKRLVLFFAAVGVSFAQGNAVQLCDQQVNSKCINWMMPAVLGATDINIQDYSLTSQGFVMSGKAIHALYPAKAEGFHAWYDTVYNITHLEAYDASSNPKPIDFSAGINGWVQSEGGFVSAVTGGSWQGYNTNTDGGLFRALAVAPNSAGTAGGSIDYGAVMYSPNPGVTCMDVYGNVAAYPTPLNGLPSNLWSSGSYSDVVEWNSTSPMQGYVNPYSGIVNVSTTAVTWVSGGSFTTGSYWNATTINLNGTNYYVASVSDSHHLTLTASAGTQTGIPYYMPWGGAWSPGVYPIAQTPCAAPPSAPVGLPYGINSSSYRFGPGFASANYAYNTFQILSDGTHTAGGMIAGQFEAASIYPQGTVTRTGTLSAPAGLGGYMYILPSDQAPSVGTIATVDNPLISGMPVSEGMFYSDSVNHCIEGYMPTNTGSLAWQCFGAWISNSTAGRQALVLNGLPGAQETAMKFQWNGTSGTNSILTGLIMTAGNHFYDANIGDMVTRLNGGGTIRMGTPTGSPYSLFQIAPTYSAFIDMANPTASQYQLFVNRHADDGSNTALEVQGVLQTSGPDTGKYHAINAVGVVQASVPPAGVDTDIVFQGQSGHFIVDKRGDVSGAGKFGTAQYFEMLGGASYTVDPSVDGSTWGGIGFTGTGCVYQAFNAATAAWATFNPCTGSGVANIIAGGHTLTGSITLTGSVDEIIIGTSTGPSVMQISTPQAINTTSSPTFAGLTLTGMISQPCIGTNGSGVIIAGTCSGGGGGAIPSITGTVNQVLVNGTSGTPQTGAITLTTPQDICTTCSPTFYWPNFSYALKIGGNASISSSNDFVGHAVNVAHGVTSQETGTNIAFQVSNYSGTPFQVNGQGYVSAYAGLGVAGAASINSLNQFVGAAVTVPGAVQAGVLGTGIAFTTSGSMFQVNGNGDASMQNLYVNNGGTTTFSVVGATGTATTTTLTASGVLQSLATGTNAAFQTNDGSGHYYFQINGAGSVGAVTYGSSATGSTVAFGVGSTFSLLGNGNVTTSGNITTSGTLYLSSLTGQSCLGTNGSGGIQAGSCGTTYLAGAGISLSGGTITNTLPTQWTTSGGGIYNTGSVAIGTSSFGTAVLTVGGAATVVGNILGTGAIEAQGTLYADAGITASTTSCPGTVPGTPVGCVSVNGHAVPYY